MNASRQFEGTTRELEKAKQRFERCESIILSIAILGTAWSAYQAALWNGIETFRLAGAAAANRAAMEKHLLTEQQFTPDAIQVLHIVDHLVEGRSNIVDFYVKRIRPELRAAVEAWIALKPVENPDTPAHPLVMPEYTERVLDPGRAEVHRLDAGAEHQLSLAHLAKQTANRYIMFTVLLASVLFFTGIAGKFDPGKARAALLVFAAVVLASVAILLLATPGARA
jgi:hypothetical protein